MIEIIIFVLVVALFLYAFLAGADFGAGILQMLPIGKRQERSYLIGKAMGPVWEANHIWLILALVISFNAFPDIFWFLSEWFHFPLGALAIGIIFRGASFTFMHYDPIQDKSQTLYHWIFGLSSLWCSMWIGIIIGSLMLGDFSISDSEIFPRYFKHWLNPFALSMGLFITALMAFNASLFLLNETTVDKPVWKKATLKVFAFLILAGLLTHILFISINFLRWKIFFLNPIGLGLIALSFLMLFPQLRAINTHKKNLSRVLAGAQLLCIMCAGFAPLYPRIILFRDLTFLDVYSSSAPDGVLKYLVYALIVGCLLILPSYAYLMKIFKTENKN